MGLADHVTDNAAFAQLTEQPLANVDKMYRMQFTTKPLRPCILCAADEMDASSTTGLNLGHAEYAGPRKKPSATPYLQIQLGRAEAVKWNQEPVFAPLDDLTLSY